MDSFWLILALNCTEAHASALGGRVSSPTKVQSAELILGGLDIASIEHTKDVAIGSNYRRCDAMLLKPASQLPISVDDAFRCGQRLIRLAQPIMQSTSPARSGWGDSPRMPGIGRLMGSAEPDLSLPRRSPDPALHPGALALRSSEERVAG